MTNISHVSKSALALGLSSVALFGFGCNPGEAIGRKVAEKVVENAIEKNVKTESGKDVNVDLSGNSMNITGDNGESLSFGEDVKIPSNFPSDVPVYPGAKANSSSIAKDGNEASLVLSTPDASSKVLEWYKAEATKIGWKQNVSLELEQGNYMLGYKMEKDGKSVVLSVNIAPSNDDAKGTAIIVARTVQD